MPSPSQKATSRSPQVVALVTSEANVASSLSLGLMVAAQAGFYLRVVVLSDSRTLSEQVKSKLSQLQEGSPNESILIDMESRERDFEALVDELEGAKSLRLLLVPGLDQLNDERKLLLKKVHTTIVCFEAHAGLELPPETQWILGEDHRNFGAWVSSRVRPELSLQETTLDELRAKNLTATTDTTQVNADASSLSQIYHGPEDWIWISTSIQDLDANGKLAKQAIEAAVGPVLLVRGEAAWSQWFFEQQLPALVSRYIPQMERKGRQALATQLQTYSKLDFEFIALISASTFLASFGLIQNSAAVIIGAMLVAPLMTPLLGAGLSLASGNRPLFWQSFRTIGIGFCAALTTSLVFGLLVRLLAPSILEHSPADELILTDEMWSRTHPTAIDFLVGLVGGSAAAFARTRVHLADALAGAAIAAALVPPLATAGLHLAFAMLKIAPQEAGESVSGLFYGPVILFVANVLTIVLGSSFVLWACGLRGAHQHSSSERWSTITTMLLMVLAAIVLVWVFQGTI